MIALFRSLFKNRRLLKEFVLRDLKARYVGSGLGFFWSVIFPIINLVVYMYVFRLILNQRFSKEWRNWIEIIGHALFLMPMAAIVVWTSWPFFLASFEQNEQSPNYGGLPQWPAKLIIPVAFAILFLQGASELIKRIAIMRGEIAGPDDEDKR